MRMDASTFEYLYSILVPNLPRQDTNMQLAILVHVKVAISISKLAINNFVQCNANLYKMSLSSS